MGFLSVSHEKPAAISLLFDDFYLLALNSTVFAITVIGAIILFVNADNQLIITIISCVKSNTLIVSFVVAIIVHLNH